MYTLTSPAVAFVTAVAVVCPLFVIPQGSAFAVALGSPSTIK
jgi:hypothetical protein